jgi:hypothetical protein
VSPALRVARRAPSTLSALCALGVVAAVTGCTAGKITNADGSNFQFPATMTTPPTVTFTNLTSGTSYMVDVTANAPNEPGLATFSFDLYGPNTATNNNETIPAGEYQVTVNFCGADQPWCISYVSNPFSHAYNGNCTDDYTGKSVQCALYNLVAYNFMNWTPCPPATWSGIYKTVPIFEGGPHPCLFAPN